jgi:RNA polymerase sigma-70 factor (ECF subfamily)
MVGMTSTHASPHGESAGFDEIGFLERIRAGDPSAVREMINRHRAMIYAKAFHMLGSHQDAEEVTQDTFINALRAVGKFRGDCRLSTWLYRIAINLSLHRQHYWERRRRGASVSLDALIGAEGATTLGDVIPEDDSCGYAAIDNDDLSDRIRVGLSRISSQHRQILILRNVDDVSYEDISRMLALSLGTVKSRIARARRSLRAVVSN